LLDFYEANPGFVYPATRLNEVRSFVEQGLKDLSVSRSSLKWGIPFPGVPDHVIYVWMDALTNYISALGFGSADTTRFDRYWPADVHLIGKDIVRFHAIYWPAFLMAAGLPLPKQIVAHGWWLRDNQKISKSVGNVVRPDEIVKRFGADAFRYFLLREMSFGHDANYSDESFLQRYNSDLANDLGNTLSRAVKMSDTYFGGKTPFDTCGANEVKDAALALVPDYLREMDAYNFQRALDVVWRLLTAINGYIVAKEPWKRFKEEGASDALARIIWNVLEGLRIVWVMMAPFMPQLAVEAFRRIGWTDVQLTRDALAWRLLPTDSPVVAGDPIFPRVDSAEYLGTSKGATVTEETKPPVPPAQEAPKAAPPAQTTEAVAPDANLISIDEFFKADLRVAEILAAEKVEKSKKLIKLRVTTGDAERTLVAGIATKYTPEELVGRKVVIVANLQPATLMGVESNGMVLAASIDGLPSLLSVDPSVPNGTKVK
ncbi:MAG: methionine--tRNA ligase subunit beta, partial [Desulfobacteria bacterium]